MTPPTQSPTEEQEKDENEEPEDGTVEAIWQSSPEVTSLEDRPSTSTAQDESEIEEEEAVPFIAPPNSPFYYRMKCVVLGYAPSTSKAIAPNPDRCAPETTILNTALNIQDFPLTTFTEHKLRKSKNLTCSLSDGYLYKSSALTSPCALNCAPSTSRSEPTSPDHSLFYAFNKFGHERNCQSAPPYLDEEKIFNSKEYVKNAAKKEKLEEVRKKKKNQYEKMKTTVEKVQAEHSADPNHQPDKPLIEICYQARKEKMRNTNEYMSGIRGKKKKIMDDLENVEKEMKSADTNWDAVNKLLERQRDGVEEIEEVEITEETNEDVPIEQRFMNECKNTRIKRSKNRLKTADTDPEPKRAPKKFIKYKLLPRGVKYNNLIKKRRFHEIQKRYKKREMTACLKSYQKYHDTRLEYLERIETWEKSKERVALDAKVREVIEKAFTEVKKEREDRERAARGERLRGEDAAAMATRKTQEEKIIKSRAIPPPLLTRREMEEDVFVERDGSIVEDMEAEHRTSISDQKDKWNPEQRKLFKARLPEHCKNFGAMTEYFYDKNALDCVAFYYLSKNEEFYKNSFVKKKKRYTNKYRPGALPTEEDLALYRLMEPLSTTDDTISGVMPKMCFCCCRPIDGLDTEGTLIPKEAYELFALSTEHAEAVCYKCREEALKLRNLKCHGDLCAAKKKMKPSKSLPPNLKELNLKQRAFVFDKIDAPRASLKFCATCYKRFAKFVDLLRTADPDLTEEFEKYIGQVKWSDKETEKLTKLINKHGVRSWEAISKKMGDKRSAIECQRQYEKLNGMKPAPEEVEKYKDKEKSEDEEETKDDDISMPSTSKASEPAKNKKQNVKNGWKKGGKGKRNENAVQDEEDEEEEDEIEEEDDEEKMEIDEKDQEEAVSMEVEENEKEKDEKKKENEKEKEEVQIEEKEKEEEKEEEEEKVVEKPIAKPVEENPQKTPELPPKVVTPIPAMPVTFAPPTPIISISTPVAVHEQNQNLEPPAKKAAMSPETAMSSLPAAFQFQQVQQQPAPNSSPISNRPTAQQLLNSSGPLLPPKVSTPKVHHPEPIRPSTQSGSITSGTPFARGAQPAVVEEQEGKTSAISTQAASLEAPKNNPQGANTETILQLLGNSALSEAQLLQVILQMQQQQHQQQHIQQLQLLQQNQIRQQVATPPATSRSRAQTLPNQMVAQSQGQQQQQQPSQQHPIQNSMVSMFEIRQLHEELMKNEINYTALNEQIEIKNRQILSLEAKRRENDSALSGLFRENTTNGLTLVNASMNALKAELEKAKEERTALSEKLTDAQKTVEKIKESICVMEKHIQKQPQQTLQAPFQRPITVSPRPIHQSIQQPKLMGSAASSSSSTPSTSSGVNQKSVIGIKQPVDSIRGMYPMTPPILTAPPPIQKPVQVNSPVSTSQPKSTKHDPIFIQLVEYQNQCILEQSRLTTTIMQLQQYKAKDAKEKLTIEQQLAQAVSSYQLNQQKTAHANQTISAYSQHQHQLKQQAQNQAQAQSQQGGSTQPSAAPEQTKRKSGYETISGLQSVPANISQPKHLQMSTSSRAAHRATTSGVGAVGAMSPAIAAQPRQQMPAIRQNVATGQVNTQTRSIVAGTSGQSVQQQQQQQQQQQAQQLTHQQQQAQMAHLIHQYSMQLAAANSANASKSSGSSTLTKQQQQQQQHNQAYQATVAAFYQQLQMVGNAFPQHQALFQQQSQGQVQQAQAHLIAQAQAQAQVQAHAQTHAQVQAQTVAQGSTQQQVPLQNAQLLSRPSTAAVASPANTNNSDDCMVVFESGPQQAPAQLPPQNQTAPKIRRPTPQMPSGNGTVGTPTPQPVIVAQPVKPAPQQPPKDVYDQFNLIRPPPEISRPIPTTQFQQHQFTPSTSISVPATSTTVSAVPDVITVAPPSTLPKAPTPIVVVNNHKMIGDAIPEPIYSDMSSDEDEAILHAAATAATTSKKTSVETPKIIEPSVPRMISLFDLEEDDLSSTVKPPSSTVSLGNSASISKLDNSASSAPYRYDILAAGQMEIEDMSDDE